MKKLIIISLLLFISCAQEDLTDKLTGKWKVTLADINGEGYSDLSIQSFKESEEKTTYHLNADKTLRFDLGTGDLQKFIGSWSYNPSREVLSLGFGKGMNENYKIETLTESELVIKSTGRKESVVLHFKKLTE